MTADESATYEFAPLLVVPFAIVALSLAAPWNVAMVAGVPVTVLTVACGISDVRSRRVPNVWILTALAYLVAVAAIAGFVRDDAAVASRMVTGAVASAAPLLLVHLVSPTGLGFGDVKFSFVLGGLVGFISPWLVAPMLLTASVAGAGVAVAHRPWRRSLPFALFLGLGSLVVIIARRPLIDWLVP